MNKFHVIAASFAAVATLAAAPPPASPDIVVSPRTHAAFAAEVSRDLQNQLDRFHRNGGYMAKGSVSIRFEPGADGRPTNVRTYRSSGDSMFDADARRVISRLNSLAPLPDGLSGNQVIQANIVVASSPAQLARIRAALAREEAQRMASSPAERNVLALSMVAAPRS